LRLVLLADSRTAASMILLRAALGAARERGVEVVGVVDTARTPPPATRIPRAVAAEVARQVFERGVGGPGPRKHLHRPWPRGVPRIAAPDVDDPAFVARVEALRPDASLALEVGQIFRRPLLDACRHPANYHDGALPQYRGIAATSWSVYRGEERSGFAFHRMREGVDDGPVLLAGDVPVAPRQTGHQVERRKTRAAAKRMGEAIALLTAEGTPQRGEPGTTTFADLDRIRTVRDPAALAYEELERRLRAFELLRMGLAGETWEVTRLRHGATGPLAFTTADGVRAEPARCAHVPLAVYRPLRRFRSGR
jgi:methionyl-tRNA formyltransferase